MTIGVAVIVLNYNGSGQTLACVDSLLRGEIGFRRLIVCDNASPDGSLLHLRDGLVARREALAGARQRWGQPATAAVAELTRDAVMDGAPCAAAVTLVDNQRNWGFGRGSNTGLLLALRDPAVTHFWLLNNDTEVLPDTLRELVLAATLRPAVGLWGATVVYHHEPARVQAWAGGAMNPLTAVTRHLGTSSPAGQVSDALAFVANVERQLHYVLGASMFATRRWVQAVGLLPEHYFLYYEELDWAVRGRPLGLALGYAPRAVVRHREGMSIGTSPSGGSALSVFYLHRSRVIFARSHGRWRMMPMVIAASLWQAAKFVLRGQIALAKATMSGTADAFWAPLTMSHGG